MPLDYDKKYREAFKKNREDVSRAVDAGELDKKINNFCKLHGFDRDDVIEQIKNNEIMAALFAKNPNKQRLHEKLAAKFIESMPSVQNFIDLGNNAKGLIHGGVLSVKELKETGASPMTKTIDFEWKYKNFQFYACHKHTTAKSGGAQDNAYQEIQKFIEEANKSNLPNTFFVAIADGEFYGYKNGKANVLRIKRLKELANDRNVFACTINELEGLMKKIAK